VSGALRGEQFPVVRVPCRIGCAPDNDLVMVGEDFASAHHAVLRYELNALYVEDVGSTNGSYLNGAQFKSATRALSPGDELRFGHTTFTVLAPMVPTAQPPRAWNRASGDGGRYAEVGLGRTLGNGYVRPANEDRMGGMRTPFGHVYVVSDGMGGYRGGALAAELIVNSLRDQLGALSPASATFAEQVRQAFQLANQEVYQRRQAEDPDTRDMGATAVALITWGTKIMVGHAGDSRAYLWSKGSGLKRLTRDHTRVQKMVEAGLVTPEQAAVHPDASILDRAMGHQPTIDVDVSTWTTLKPGDMVLLCSDGLSGYVDDSEIATILRSTGDPSVLASKLVDCALMKGGADNVTVQLFGRRRVRVVTAEADEQAGCAAAGHGGDVGCDSVGSGDKLGSFCRQAYRAASAEAGFGDSRAEQPAETGRGHGEFCGRVAEARCARARTCGEPCRASSSTNGGRFDHRAQSHDRQKREKKTTRDPPWPPPPAPPPPAPGRRRRRSDSPALMPSDEAVGVAPAALSGQGSASLAAAQLRSDGLRCEAIQITRPV
jgi:protein phosphatase